MRKEYVLLVDPGKKRDPAAIMIMKERKAIVNGSPAAGVPDMVKYYYDIVHINKVIDIRYTELSKIVCAMSNHIDLKNNHTLIVDGTGVGEAVIDIMREHKLNPVSIVFTGGEQVREVFQDFGKVFGSTGNGLLNTAKVLKEIHVPKNDMVDAGRNIIQQARLTIASGVKFEKDFRNQLLAFRGSVNEKTKRVSYNSETEQDHDDLVVCYLMGAWWFTRSRKTDEQIIPKSDKHITQDWDPLDFL